MHDLEFLLSFDNSLSFIFMSHISQMCFKLNKVSNCNRCIFKFSYPRFVHKHATRRKLLGRWTSNCQRQKEPPGNSEARRIFRLKGGKASAMERECKFSKISLTISHQLELIDSLSDFSFSPRFFHKPSIIWHGVSAKERLSSKRAFTTLQNSQEIN